MSSATPKRSPRSRSRWRSSQTSRAPGPQRLAQCALDGWPVAKSALVGDDQDTRRAVGGRARFAVLPSHALKEAFPGVAGVDLEEVRRRSARANLDVTECIGAERHLLPDLDILGWHARVEVSEAKVVATDTLEEQA